MHETQWLNGQSMVVTGFKKSGKSTGYQYANVGLGIGRGRAELVTDAATAMFLLQDLQKAGSLARTITAEDVGAVSKAVTAANTLRFFDQRMRRIRQLEILDSVLSSRGITKPGLPRNVMIVNDNLYFANHQSRFCGSGFVVTLYGSMLNNSKNLFFDNNLLSLAGSYDSSLYTSNGANWKSVVAGYFLNKPHTLNWQSDLSINLGVTKKGNQSISRFTGWPVWNISSFYYYSHLSATYTLSYFPTTRTSYSLYTNYLVTRRFQNTAVIDGFDQHLFTWVTVNKWISPRYRAFARAGLSVDRFSDFVNAWITYHTNAFAGFTYFLY